MAKKKKKAAPKQKAQPKQRRESRQQQVIEEAEPETDQMSLGVIIMTGVFLVAAIVINMMHLGHFDVGPFK